MKTQSQLQPSPPDRWAWHHAALQKLKESLLKERHDQQLAAGSPVEQDSNDTADCATDEFDHNLAFAMLSQKDSAIQEIDAALGRILYGTYGVCEETGKPIPAARLRAIPWARFSKEVQERLEKEGLASPTHLAPASDIHGTLKSDLPAPDPPRPRHRTKEQRRAARNQQAAGKEAG